MRQRRGALAVRPKAVLDGFVELIRVRGNVRDGFINADKVLVWFGITPH